CPPRGGRLPPRGAFAVPAERSVLTRFRSAVERDVFAHDLAAPSRPSRGPPLTAVPRDQAGRSDLVAFLPAPTAGRLPPPVRPGLPSGHRGRWLGDRNPTAGRRNDHA